MVTNVLASKFSGISPGKECLNVFFNIYSLTNVDNVTGHLIYWSWPMGAVYTNISSESTWSFHHIVCHSFLFGMKYHVFGIAIVDIETRVCM